MLYLQGAISAIPDCSIIDTQHLMPIQHYIHYSISTYHYHAQTALTRKGGKFWGKSEKQLFYLI
jgi:hypothetical protein